MNLDVIEVDLSSWRKPCPSQAAPAAIDDIIFQHAPRQWLQKHRYFPNFYRLLRYVLEKLSVLRTLKEGRSDNPEQLSLHLHRGKCTQGWSCEVLVNTVKVSGAGKKQT